LSALAIGGGCRQYSEGMIGKKTAHPSSALKVNHVRKDSGFAENMFAAGRSWPGVSIMKPRSWPFLESLSEVVSKRK
jgi:hypothetical protein